jgi:hypothetical protein
MCDIISELCNICCDIINKDKEEQNIYFSNENTYDILFNKQATNYVIYHNLINSCIHSIENKFREENFKIKNNFADNSFEIVKNDIKIKFMSTIKLKEDVNPYKNIVLNINKQALFHKHNSNFIKIADIKKFFNDKKSECIDLILDYKCNMLDFIYIFIKWQNIDSMIIVDDFIKNCSNKYFKKNMINYYNDNTKLIIDFLKSLDDVENGVYMWSKLVETKLHVLTEILFLKKHIRLYNYTIKSSREYLKFVCFAKYIDISQEYSIYFKHINKINTVLQPDITIVKKKVRLHNKMYSPLAKLNTIKMFKQCDDSIKKNILFKHTQDVHLRRSLKSFYQIMYGYFQKDYLDCDIETLKYSFICKKCDMLHDELNENINILNHICGSFGFKNKIQDDDFIYNLINNKSAMNYGFKCSHKLHEIKKSGGNPFDIYDYQNFYYLFLEQLYLNKYEENENEEINNNIYDKILNIIIEKLIDEKNKKRNIKKVFIDRNDSDSDDSSDDYLNSFAFSDIVDLKPDDDILLSVYDDDDDSMIDDINLDSMLEKFNLNMTVDKIIDNKFVELNIEQEDDKLDELNMELKENIEEEILETMEDEIDSLKITNINILDEIADMKILIVKELIEMPNFETKLIEDVNKITQQDINKILDYYNVK